VGAEQGAGGPARAQHRAPVPGGAAGAGGWGLALGVGGWVPASRLCNAAGLLAGQPASASPLHPNPPTPHPSAPTGAAAGGRGGGGRRVPVQLLEPGAAAHPERLGHAAAVRTRAARLAGQRGCRPAAAARCQAAPAACCRAAQRAAPPGCSACRRRTAADHRTKLAISYALAQRCGLLGACWAPARRRRLVAAVPVLRLLGVPGPLACSGRCLATGQATAPSPPVPPSLSSLPTIHQLLPPTTTSTPTTTTTTTTSHHNHNHPPPTAAPSSRYTSSAWWTW
jgi:hypothetical protein